MWPRTGRDSGALPRIEQTERPSWSSAVWSPPTDVLVTDDAVIVRVELAGTAPDDVQVLAGTDELVVSGCRRVPSGSRPQRINRMEIAFGPFERSIPLPSPVCPEAAQARLADGLLEVVLPVAEPHRPAPSASGAVLIILSHRR